MSIIDISLHARRARRRRAAAHIYAVGQVVRMRATGARTARTAEIFRITAKLPPQEGLPQYRLRNMTERFERVAAQDTIEPVAQCASDAPIRLESVFADTRDAKRTSVFTE